jgi:hypothetical protein
MSDPKIISSAYKSPFMPQQRKTQKNLSKNSIKEA